MSFTTTTNFITILFCLAVLVQSVRMMRSLKTIKEGQFDKTVSTLETATAQAHNVLTELKRTLATDGIANVRTLAEAKEIREELDVLVGIANSMAERLVTAATSEQRREEPRIKPIAAPAGENEKVKLWVYPARPPKAQRPAKPAAASRREPAKTGEAA